MPSAVNLSIVIPVFNGAANIERLVHELAEIELDGSLQIVLVNDGSSDNSAEICKKLAEQLTVPITFVNLARNFGEHNAVMAGLRFARGEWMITIDDDFQNPPSEVVKLYEHARYSEHDVIYTHYRSREHPTWRRFGSWLANYVADILLEKPKGLYLSSFRCMRQLIVHEILNYSGPFPYIDGLILQVTQNIDTIEVEHASRKRGRSNYTMRRLIRLWLNLFVNFSVMPLRISTVLGFLLSIFGFLFFIYVVLDHFLVGSPVVGWGSLMSTILVFSGTQLLILGIMGEYLGRVHLTSNKRPQYVIREVVRELEFIEEIERLPSETPAAR